MPIKMTKKVFDSLVGENRCLSYGTGYRIFATISPNPATAIKVRRLNKNTDRMNTLLMRYDLIKSQEQFTYCIDIFKKCYLEFLTEKCQYVGTFEFNKSGNIHLHILFSDDNIKNSAQLHVFRRDVGNCQEVINNKKRINNRDMMNNIVPLTKDLDDICDYLIKDWDENKDLENMYNFTNNNEADAEGNAEAQKEAQCVIKKKVLKERQIVDLCDELNLSLEKYFLT